MTTQLSLVANEKSTFAITMSFADESGAAVTPNSATWTLSDDDGNIINNRQSVVISPLSSTVTVVLSGNDLAISTFGEDRIFTVEAVYDSSLGSDLPLKDEIKFKINDLENVS